MTPLLWLKLRRDLRGTWPRMVLMVAAIAVSLTVFSGVLYVRGITAREIKAAYLGTNPPSATVVLDRGVDARQMEDIAAKARTRPGIIDAVARTQFTTQVQDARGRWQADPLQIFVFAPDDPLRMARFQAEEDAWPPAPGDILVDREALTLLGLKVGDTVTIKSAAGTPARLRVSGVAHDPSLAPPAQEQKGYGFLSTTSLPTLGEAVTLDELKIQVANKPGGTTPSHSRDTIAASGRELGGWLQQRFGVAVREVQVPEPYAHPHQGQLNVLLLAMLIFGLAAMILSAILVATMLNGLFIQQIPQIGIMKAIGARTGRIARFYLLMTLLVAMAATALAIGPGIAISRFLAPRILTGLLGMDATSLLAPLWMYALVVAIGIVLPPVMALVPLIKASRTTVRAAIDYRGVGSRSSGRLDAWLGRLRGNRMLMMALRNSLRRRARFLLAIGLLASAGTLFVSGLSTLDGAQTVLKQGNAQRHWDVEVSIAGTTSAAEATSIAERIPHVRRAEAWTITETGVAQPGQLGITRTYPDQEHGSLAVTAVPAGQTAQSVPKMIEGRWLRSGETGAIVLNQIARANAMPGIRPGGTVQLTVGGRPTTWRVVGIAEEMFVGTGAYVTADGYAQATGQTLQVNDLRIVTDKHDEQTRADVADAVERALTDGSFTVKSAASVGRMEEASTGHMLPIIMILLAIAVAMGLVGCIGLASTMSANVLERTREFGIMHAIGARPAAVRRTVIFEGIFIAMASCVAAAVPVLALTAVMGAGLGNMFMYAPLPLRISASAAVIWAVVVIVGAAVATLFPASRASRLTVREALSYL